MIVRLKVAARTIFKLCVIVEFLALLLVMGSKPSNNLQIGDALQLLFGLPLIYSLFWWMAFAAGASLIRPPYDEYLDALELDKPTKIAKK